MGVFLVYILKSAFCLALLYSFYRLLMSEETFHRFNRVALLALLVISFVLPLMTFGESLLIEVGQVAMTTESTVAIDAVEPSMASESLLDFGWEHAMLLLYIIGFLACVCYHAVSYIRLGMLLRKTHQEPLSDYTAERHKAGIKLYVHEEELSPFSWLNCIVVSRRSIEESAREVLRHELAHIEHRHSWDLLLVDACTLLQWFNPAVWLLKRELRTLHEYEADEAVIKGGADTKEYQRLLIKEAVGTRLYSMANNLNHSSLKKRITMMLKRKSNPWARLKYLYVLPLAAASVAVFARPEVSNTLDEISSAKVSELTSIAKAEEVKSVESPSRNRVKVSGKVVDAKSGKGLAGVNIFAKNPNDGRIASAALSQKGGKFEFETYEGLALQFSFVGMQEQYVIVPQGGAKSLTVQMAEAVQGLPDMVVTGYAPETVEGLPANLLTAESMGSKDGDEGRFVVVESQPEYPGGMGELVKFLSRNVKYPVAAQQARVQGRVIVEFLVGTDGNISDIKVKHSVCPELDAEAMRVIGLMPKWRPGEQRGKAVSVRYEMPIEFRLK
jgi:TonB family protein